MADVRREHDSLGEIEVPADRLRRADPALAREFPDRPRPLRLAAAGDPRLRDPEEGGSTRQRHARATRSGGGTIRAALDGLYELPLGGTAVGIGLNAPATRSGKRPICSQSAPRMMRWSPRARLCIRQRARR
jgi:hypothetical protein